MSKPEMLPLSEQVLPSHVAIIMDGNGRWAKQRGKLRLFGHQAGVKSVRQSINMAGRLGIKQLTLFAFSSENWKRPEEEVSSLMALFLTVLQREVKKLNKNNVKLRIIGDTSRFNAQLRQRIQIAEETTAENSGLILNIAANYGGRWDIATACQKLATQVACGNLASSAIDETLLGQTIDNEFVGDVDLMIRTGGERRLSNFLIWQMAYAELYFTEKLWPDFDELAFSEAIASYVDRERRFGCTSEQIQALANT